MTDRRNRRWVLARKGSLAGKRILEVGAGTGRDAVVLAKAGAEVLTLDYVAGSLGLTVKAATRTGVVATLLGSVSLAHHSAAL